MLLTSRTIAFTFQLRNAKLYYSGHLKLIYTSEVSGDGCGDVRAITLVCKSNKGEGTKRRRMREGNKTEGFLFYYGFFTSYVAYVQCKLLVKKAETEK